MRIDSQEQDADSMEFDNRDVDMRVLTMGMRPIEQKKPKKSDPRSPPKSTSNDLPTTTTTHSQKTIDYSQYLKDANIDLNQSDLDDPLGKYFGICLCVENVLLLFLCVSNGI